MLRKPKIKPINLATLLIIFILPFTIVVYQLVAEINQRVNVAQAEIYGNRYLQPLEQLLQEVPAGKLVTHRYVKQDATLPMLRQQQQRVDDAIAALAEVEHQYGCRLGTAELFSPLDQTWQHLKAQTNLAPDDAKQAEVQRLYTQLTAQVRTLMAQVGNQSSLILDPDLDSYYLMDAVLLNLPEEQDLLARVRQLGEDLVKRRALTVEEKRRLTVLMGQLSENINTTRNGFGVAFRQNLALKPPLEASLQTLVTAIAKYLTVLNEATVQAKTVQVQPTAYNWADYDAATLSALTASSDLWQITSTELERLLQQRLQTFTHKTSLIEAFAILVLVTASYVLTEFSRNIRYQQRSQQRLRAQQAITQVLAEAPALREATPAILQALCERLNWDRGELYSRAAGESTLTFVASWHSSDPSLSDPASRDLEVSDLEVNDQRSPAPTSARFPQPMGESQAPSLIEHLAPEQWHDRHNSPTHISLSGAIGFPIWSGEELAGVISVFGRAIAKPDPELLKTMATIGSQIGQFMKIKRAEAALRQSEELQRMALNAAQMGAWDWNILNGAEHWSTEAERIFGVGSGGFTGSYEDFCKFIHPDDQAIVEEAQRRTLLHGDDYAPEYRIIRSDGSTRWLTSRGQVLRDEAGKPTRLTGVVMDITERKHAEAALREREQRFRSLLTNISGAVYRCKNDPQWTMEFISDAIKDITGYTADDFIDSKTLSFDSIILPEDSAMIEQMVERAIQHRQPYVLEYRINHADGQVRWVYEKGQAIVDAQGAVVCLDGVIVDITERTQKEERLRLLESAVVNTNDAVVITKTSLI